MQIGFGNCFVRKKIEGENFAQTYPKVALKDRNIFDTYRPLSGSEVTPSYWKTGKHSKIHGDILVHESFLSTPLLGKWCAAKSERVDKQRVGYGRFRRAHVIRRVGLLDLWFENEEDYLLLKLKGLPI
jgi:hypothetical protein